MVINFTNFVTKTILETVHLEECEKCILVVIHWSVGQDINLHPKLLYIYPCFHQVWGQNGKH